MAIGGVKAHSPGYYKFSIVFLVFIILITLAIFLYKGSISQKNDALVSQVGELKTLIATMREDKDVQAYELYETNKTQLDEFEYLSNIPKFQSALNTISRNYNVDFQRFSYSKGVITVSAIAGGDSTDEAYEKLRTLISDFRSQDQVGEDGETKNFIFDLNFVEAFKGTKNISATMNFEVKPEEKVDPIQKEAEEKKTIEAAVKK